LKDSYNAFTIVVEIESIIEKDWSPFKAGDTSIIGNIAFQNLIWYKYAKIKIVLDYYCNYFNFDNTEIVSNLLMWKIGSNHINQIKAIKNQVNFFHDLLLMKDKRKKFVKTNDELDSFWEYYEPVIFGYHKRKNDENYNVHLTNTYDL
jgi:hypothetical protein